MHLRAQRHVFGVDAGFASWIFAEHDLDSHQSGQEASDALARALVLKGSFALGGTPSDLLMCAGCATTRMIEQELCSLDKFESGECLEASGQVSLGGMALIDNVRCPWEFKNMNILELHTIEFMPLTSQDVVEICHDGYDYKTCRNFTASTPPPQRFYIRPPCKLTLYALSAYETVPAERIAWAQMRPGANRFVPPSAFIACV